MATMSNMHHQVDDYFQPSHNQQPSPQHPTSNKNSLNGGNSYPQNEPSPRQSFQTHSPQPQPPSYHNNPTPRHQQQQQQQDHQQQQQRANQNYNGFMTHRDSDQNNHLSQQQHQQQQQQQNNDNYNRYNNFNQNNDQGSHKSLSLEYGKSIKLLKNGDEFFRGQKFVINSRKYRYYDVFLDDISYSMSANFGAVRNIYTPNQGHRIHSLDELEDGKTYVAAGKGKFVRLNYSDVSQGKRLPPHKLPALTRQDYNAISVPQYDRPNNIVIYVYKNGDVLSPPAKILLYRNTLTSFEACLDSVTEKVKLTNGAVLRLYTMEGEHVISPAQFISGHSYVAAHKEKFKKCDYLAAPNDFNLSPRLNRKSNSQPVSHPSSNPSTSGKSNLSYNSYYQGKPYTGWHKERRDNSLPPVTGPKPPNTSNSGSQQGSNFTNYHATNNPNNRNTNKVNVDKDESGFYKARQQNSYDARTVPDNRNMYVDMPVDYKKTNQIDREEIGQHKNNNRNQIAVANSKQAPLNQNNSSPNNYNNQHKMSTGGAATNSQNKMNLIDEIEHNLTGQRHQQASQKNVSNQPNQTPMGNRQARDDDDDDDRFKSDRRNDAHNESRQSVSNMNKNQNQSRTQYSPPPTINSTTNNHTYDNKTSINNQNSKELSPDDAAVLIQSVYRGYKTRTDLKNKNINVY